MRFCLFSMRDNKSGVFLQPFVARSESDARRQLTAAFDDPSFLQTPAGRYPQEFDLYSLGDFDDESGEINSARPRSVVSLATLRPLPPDSTVRS